MDAAPAGALRACLETFAILEREIGSLDQSAAGKEYGCYPALPYAPAKFMAALQTALDYLESTGRTENRTFLDIGCGIGTKVLLASYLFKEAVGSELDPIYLAVAEGLHRRAALGNVRFANIDGLTFTGYAEFDVVFLYRPFRDAAKQRQLEQQVARTVSPGTVILGPHCDLDELAKSEGLRSLDTYLHVKSG